MAKKSILELNIIKCAICLLPWNSRNELNVHLTESHNENLKEDEIKFASIEEFNEWKKTEEANNNTTFRVIHRSVSKTGTTHLFYCKKSGHFKQSYKCLGIKQEEKCHCPPTCPAKMFLTEYDLKKEVIVSYLNKHLGHDNSPVTRFRSAHPCHKPRQQNNASASTPKTTIKRVKKHNTDNDIEIANAVKELISEQVVKSNPLNVDNNTANSSDNQMDNDQSSFDCHYEDDYQDSQPIEVATIVNYNCDSGVTSVTNCDFLTRFLKLNYQNQNLVREYIDRLYDIQEQYRVQQEQQQVQQQQQQINTVLQYNVNFQQQQNFQNIIFQQHQLQQQQQQQHQTNLTHHH